MDFDLGEEHQAVAELAAQIMGDLSTPSRLAELEASGAGLDAELWGRLADANLLSVSLSEDVGGSGLGFMATALVALEAGRRTARVPLVPSVVTGAMAIDSFGSEVARKEVLPKAAAGEAVLTCALGEPDGADPVEPATRAVRAPGGWLLTGTKVCVPAGMEASWILVPASTETGGVGIFVVDSTGGGVEKVPQETTDWTRECHLELSGARCEDAFVLGDPDGDPRRAAEIVRWITERQVAALAMEAAGACQEALRLTAEHAKQREQFDRPIGSFQAVAQRAADAYIDTEAVRLTALQAAWRLDAGMDAAAAVEITAYWACEGGQRVVLAAQHLHGGLGVDRDYPLHRYFLRMKKIELAIGGANAHLARFGKMLAEEPV